MGNNLCKERIERANDSKNPIDRIIGRCSQICPNSVTGNKSDWNKHVLETRPPMQTQPQRGDNWKNMTLTVPDGKQPRTEIAPIAPPRKKRRSSSFAATSHPIPNGFRDVFGNEDRRYSHESVFLPDKKIVVDHPNGGIGDREYNVIKVRRRSYSTSTDDFADFSKEIKTPNAVDPSGSTQHVSKVGNRKTDKFFGENLSVCLSDEQIAESGILAEVKAAEAKIAEELSSAMPDAIDKFIVNNAKGMVQENAVKQEKVTAVRAPPPDPPKRRNSQSKGQISSTSTSQLKEEIDREQKTSSLDRKAEFLMAMLSNEASNPEDEYKGREPIEEPLMVLRTKDQNCPCCDDDETLRKHLYKHEQAEEEKLKAVPDTAPPPKPVRDLNIYRLSQEVSDATVAEAMKAISAPTVEVSQTKNVEPPQRMNRNKRHVSREDLPNPPPRPKKVIETSETNSKKVKPPPILIPTPDHAHPHVTHLNDVEKDNANLSEQNAKLHRNISMPAVDLVVDEKVDSLLKKCKSSNSFLNQEIMDEIMKKAYQGFGEFEQNYWDHDHNDCFDGSGLVSPSFKLENRKVSFTRLSSTSLEKTPEINSGGNGELSPTKMKFSIGPNLITVSEAEKHINENVLTPTVNVVEIEKEKETESKLKELSKPKILIAPELKMTEHNSTASSKKHSTSTEPTNKDNKLPTKSASTQNEPEIMTHKLEEIIKKSHLLDEPKKAMELTDLSNVLDDIYKTNSKILDDFQHYLEDNIKVDVTNNRFRKVPTNPNFEIDQITFNEGIPEPSEKSSEVDLDEEDLDLVGDDDESVTESGSELKDDVEGGLKIENKLVSAVKGRRGRRESIDDVDWFERHVDNPLQNKSVNDLIYGTRERRGSEGNITYDTSRIYPFGKIQRGRNLSISSDFFENRNLVLSQSHGDISDINEMEQKEGGGDHDHSGLLKIIQRESPKKDEKK